MDLEMYYPSQCRVSTRDFEELPELRPSDVARPKGKRGKKKVKTMVDVSKNLRTPKGNKYSMLSGDAEPLQKLFSLAADSGMLKL